MATALHEHWEISAYFSEVFASCIPQQVENYRSSFPGAKSRVLHTEGSQLLQMTGHLYLALQVTK